MHVNSTPMDPQLILLYLLQKAGPGLTGDTTFTCYSEDRAHFVMMSLNDFPETHLVKHLRLLSEEPQLRFFQPDEFVLTVLDDGESYFIDGPFNARWTTPKTKKDAFPLLLNNEHELHCASID
jgi:hypothetical protein